MRANLPSIAALTAGAAALAHGRARPRRMGLFHNEPVFERNVHLRIPIGTTLAAAALLVAGGFLLSKTLRRGGSGTTSSTVEESIELDVPVGTAYNQWTQFEEFPKFMASVESVTQIDDAHLHWRALVGGKMKEWDAEITEQIPDKRIAWRSIGGVPNGGVVTFHKLSDTRSRVMLQMEYTPESIGEKLGNAVGAVKLTAKGNLKKFKHLVEARGVETGGWRGSIAQH